MPNAHKTINGSVAGGNRLSGKVASDAFKQGNNAGMLFKKEAKAATNVHQYVGALQRLRMAETRANGDSLRSFA
jgi:hypothetical protein